MNVEIGTEAAHFLFCEYINEIFVSMLNIFPMCGGAESNERLIHKIHYFFSNQAFLSWQSERHLLNCSTVPLL
jgi:hypothetical protein